MNKRVFYSVFFFLCSSFLQAQEYGFEWINYSQSYYKIPVGKDGLYKLTYQDLSDAGLPLSSIDPRAIQLFHRGVEQAIHVEGQQDARLDPGDYLIFYGVKNDGTLDKQLYQPSGALPHAHYNLYSDTTSYFLTWKFSGADGKRMESFKETNTSGIAKENAQITLIRDIYTDQYSQGRTFFDYTRYSQFDYGEGFTGKRIQENQSVQYRISGIENIITTAAGPQLKVMVVGRGDENHRAEISVGKDAASLRILDSIDFKGYTTGLLQGDITYSDISSTGELVVQVKALGINGGNDRLSTSFVELTYPATFDQENTSDKTYRLKENALGKSYIEIINVPSGTELYDVTDKNNVLKIGFNLDNSTVKAVVPNTSVQTKLKSVSSYLKPSIERVNFRKFDPSSAGYILISHPELMQPFGNYPDAIQAYAAYRASADGGSYDTLIADVIQLYNQFSYGEITPLAIFNFVQWLKDTASPEYLFFVGEGLEVSFNYHRNPSGFNYRDLVPPAGMPASDILYSAGLGQQTYQPSVPTGRLTASTAEEVVNYLEKVKVMENMPFDDLWRKKVLHLSGGIRESEIAIFKRYMDVFAALAKAPYLGGSVKTIQKDTKTAVEQINISEEVNNGLNLVTFFGHSAPTVTDIDIGFVSNELYNYDNKNKYPVFVINGCNAGRFFVDDLLFGEDWMLAANKGAIGFIAHTSYGYVYDLKTYTTTFYETGYGDSVFIEKSLGKIHQETIKRFIEKITTPDPSEITQAQQMLLLGDPATYLFGAKAPDYAVEEGNVFVSSFDGSPVTALSDSFAINVVVKNYGKALPDSFHVSLQRQIGDKLYNQDSVFKSTLFKDTLQLVIKRNSLEDFGTNLFTITIDDNNEFTELNENNNSIQYSYFLKLDATRNLLPYAYAVVNDTTDQVVVQSTDILAREREFIIELDTTSTFNSSQLQSAIVQERLLAEWDLNYLDQDTTTYFLRSKFSNPAPDENNEWNYSSFIKLKNGATGWGQNHPHQLKENAFTEVSFDPLTGKFAFEETVIENTVTTMGSDHPFDLSAVSVVIDNAEYMVDNGRRCRDNTINLIAFDKEKATPYAAIDFVFLDWRTCGRQPQVINSFKSNEIFTGSGDDIIEAIDNIASGDSIILFSIGDPSYSTWVPEVKMKLEEIGIPASAWENINDGEPIIFAAKKGVNPGQASLFKATGDSLTYQEVSADISITGISSSGTVKSPVIGPVDEWYEIKLEVDTTAADKVTLDIEAIDNEGNITSFAKNINVFQYDLSSLDATNFPYLRLSLNIIDKKDLTAPQLKQWFVTYLPSADGIVLPATFDNKFVREEGDTLKVTGSFFNLSPWKFQDSLKVSSKTSVSAGRLKGAEDFYIKAPDPGDTVYFDLIFPTNGLVGENDLNLMVNQEKVPEQYYENNILTINNFLEVEKDQSAPVLDVRFDGIHIFNKDIVSPDPLITAVVKDENLYLQRKDTAGLNLYLKSNCESCAYRRIAFSSPHVNYYSVEGKNEFVIEYRPGPLDNGIYSLRILAADVTGNKAGDKPYEVEFNVINESSITHFYPYPNPFSSSVRFVFTLTGSNLPDQLFVQIMTISGRVVKEINLSEFGLLRIGNNISEYAWDGRDEFGDQLANGVYLYKVTAKKDGKEIELRPSAGDAMFKKGYGKLYLLR